MTQELYSDCCSAPPNFYFSIDNNEGICSACGEYCRFEDYEDTECIECGGEMIDGECISCGNPE